MAWYDDINTPIILQDFNRFLDATADKGAQRRVSFWMMTAKVNEDNRLAIPQAIGLQTTKGGGSPKRAQKCELLIAFFGKGGLRGSNPRLDALGERLYNQQAGSRDKVKFEATTAWAEQQGLDIDAAFPEILTLQNSLTGLIQKLFDQWQTSLAELEVTGGKTQKDMDSIRKQQKCKLVGFKPKTTGYFILFTRMTSGHPLLILSDKGLPSSKLIMKAAPRTGVRCFRWRGTYELQNKSVSFLIKSIDNVEGAESLQSMAAKTKESAFFQQALTDMGIATTTLYANAKISPDLDVGTDVVHF